MKNNFLLSAILICAMAICGAFAINVTYASTSAPQVQAIYLEGYNNEKYPNENFTAFVGGVVAIDVESDSELNYYNYDGVTTSLVSTSGNVHTVTITSNQPMQTQVIFENSGGYSFVNVEFVENAIENVSIIAPFMVSNAQNSTFKLLFNDNPMLKYVGQVDYSLSINGGDRIDLISGGEYVENLNSREITLDFSAFTEDTNVTLYAKIGEVESFCDFTVQNRPLSAVFLVDSSSVGYMDGSSSVVVNVSISANSLADFTVMDDFIRLESVQFVGQADGLDTYALTLDISYVDTPNLVIISGQTAQGQVLRGVNLHNLSTITSFEITTEKDTYSPNETIVVTAVVDGEETLSGNIVWYVNGIEYSQGATLSLQRSEGGSFTIYAMINDIQSNTLTLNITYQSVELIIWYCVLALTIVVLVGLIIFKKKKKNYYMSTSLLERARKIIPRYETHINNYNKRQFKKLIYDLAMLRDDTYANFTDTKDFCFERAGRGFAGATSAMRAIYKADKDQRQTAFIENTKGIEDNIKMAINALEEYSQAHPNEKIFAFNRNKRKKTKEINKKENGLFAKFDKPTVEAKSSEIGKENEVENKPNFTENTSVNDSNNEKLDSTNLIDEDKQIKDNKQNID